MNIIYNQEMDSLEIRTGLKQTQHDNGSSKRKSVSKVNGPQFTIPRLKKIKRDLLTDLTLDSHECQQEILAPIRKSFHFPFSTSGHEFTRVQSVYNSELTGKYLEKRKEMKSSGYPDALLADNFAFIAIEHPSTVAKLCKDGIRCGNQQFSGLGVSHMAVHVCKHADIVTPNRPKCGEKILLVVKVIKGKVKTVLCKNVGVQLEPTPNYDCHMAKPNADQSALQAPHMLLYSTQLYLYEYGEFEIEEYPRQVLPYAVVYYVLKDPQAVSPKVVTSLPHQVPASTLPTLPPGGTAQSPNYQSLTSTPQDTGPSNEVWRGRLHLRLTAGGQISIDVAMLSYFVPLTVTLISPVIIHGLYPEHNAQFTFFGGLTNIAHKDEVEWRAHYFKSFVMRPRPNNEEHFKALIKHVSAKREMPTVKLPNGVFLFLMPNCLLASQLGLVRRDDDSPVLHCVLMSNFSTNEAQKKKLVEKKKPFKNFGSATSWENLFDDSDFSDDDMEDEKMQKIKHSLSRKLPPLFNEQRKIHNKFAAMSLADADINFAQCSCKKLSLSKAHQQRRRDDDVARVLASIQAASLSGQKGKVSHFPAASSSKPKQQVSRRAKAMPSFSPHGSDSDTENGPGASSKHHDRFTLLDSTKTVEEELSEEELTNEQMEDIIFLRKPAITTSSSLRPKAHLTRDKTLVLGEKTDTKTQAHLKYSRSTATKQGLTSSHPMSDFHKSSSEPVLNYKPKIIPTEPLITEASKPMSRAKIIPVEPKIIPTEPVVDPPDQGASVVVPLPTAEVSLKKADAVPQSILKNRTTPSVKSAKPLFTEKVKEEIIMPLHVPLDEDFGDVDMRIPNQQPATLHPVFLSARQPPTLHHSPPEQQLSPNFAFGSWLTPAEIQASSSVKVEESSPVFRTPSPSSPISPPSESPPSPVDSPISPPLDSPASPPPVLDTESPASPPQSVYAKSFRSSPIAIPTSRIYQNASPEVSHVHCSLYKTRAVEELDNSQVCRSSRTRTRSREGIDNADDMKDFLNSGFDSDLDSSYEDER